MAHKDLTTFVSQYLNLLDQHLSLVKGQIDGTVTRIGEGVRQIDAIAEKKSQHADTALVRGEAGKGFENAQGGGSDFRAQSLNSLDKNEAKAHGKELSEAAKGMSTGVKKAGSEMKQKIDSMNSMQSKIQSLLLDIMAALSSDDVINQRISHVQAACSSLIGELEKIKETTNSSMNSECIESLRFRVLEKVSKSYTMVNETQILKNVFGNELTRKAS